MAVELHLVPYDQVETVSVQVGHPEVVGAYNIVINCMPNPDTSEVDVKVLLPVGVTATGTAELIRYAGMVLLGIEVSTTPEEVSTTPEPSGE